MKKFFLASTLIAAATLVVPAWAEDTLPITSITNDEEVATEALDSFVLESIKAIVDDEGYGWDSVVDTDPNLRIGAREDALLVVTDGANVSTSAHLNAISSNLAMGTIFGEGSTLATKQIALVGGISSPSGSDSYADGASYWTQYLTSATNSSAAITTFSSGYSDETSYGIAYFSTNTTEYGNISTMASGADSSTGNNSRFLSDDGLTIENGDTRTVGSGEEITIPAGNSAIIYGELIIQNGGSVSSAGDGLFELIIGDAAHASDSNTSGVLVSGTDSSFNVLVDTSDSGNYDGIYIGSNSTSGTGGAVDVSISATDGGVFKASTYGGIFVAMDGTISDPSTSHSNGINVELTASSGGSLTLEAIRDASHRSSSENNNAADGDIYLGLGSAASEYKKTITATATGEGSTLMISGYNVFANYSQSSNLATSFVAEKGGSLTIAAENQVVFGFEVSSVSNSTIEVKADGGTVSISAIDVYTNYLSGDLKSELGAYNGGTLTITGSNEISLGIGRDPNTKATDDMTGGTMTITANGEGSKVTLTAGSGSNANQRLFINYETRGLSSTITASDGGCIYMSGGEIDIGYGSSTRQYEGNIKINATGSGSRIDIVAWNEVAINQQTIEGSTTTFLAEDGGYIYIGTTRTGSSTLVSASVYFGWATLSSSTDGKTIGGDIIVKATGAGSTIEISAGKYIYANSESVANAKTYITASDGGKLIFTAGTSSQFNIGTEISITTGGSFSTTATVFNSSSSISIDGTSSWTGGQTEFHDTSSISITAGASAAQGTANVSLGEVYIESSAAITIVIDVASLGYGVTESVAVLTAKSIIFDVTSWSKYSGTELSESNLDTFISSYVTLEEIGFTLDSWSYLANDDDTYTLYANVTTFAPEPGMFSLFAGIGALGLIATRRRRQHHRKAALLP